MMEVSKMKRSTVAINHTKNGETERLKRLQKQLARQKKGSNNRYKTKKLLQREYQKMTNRKTDAANKIVAELLQHEKVYMQDEQINNWKKLRFGSRKIQHSVLGRVKAKLMQNERVIVLDKMVSTTKYCPMCKSKNGIKLSDRVYSCFCGYSEDRDLHSARNMIVMTKEGFSHKKNRSS